MQELFNATLSISVALISFFIYKITKINIDLNTRLCNVEQILNDLLTDLDETDADEDITQQDDNPQHRHCSCNNHNT